MQCNASSIIDSAEGVKTSQHDQPGACKPVQGTWKQIEFSMTLPQQRIRTEVQYLLLLLIIIKYTDMISSRRPRSTRVGYGMSRAGYGMSVLCTVLAT